MPTQVKIMGPKQGHRGHVLVQEADTARPARPGDAGFMGVASKSPAVIGPGEERDFWVRPGMQLLVTEHEGVPQPRAPATNGGPDAAAKETLAAISEHRKPRQAPAKKAGRRK